MSNWSGQQQLLSDKPTRRNWYMDVLAHGHVSFRLLDVAAPCWSFRAFGQSLIKPRSDWQVSGARNLRR